MPISVENDRYLRNNSSLGPCALKEKSVEEKYASPVAILTGSLVRDVLAGVTLADVGFELKIHVPVGESQV